MKPQVFDELIKGQIIENAVVIDILHEGLPVFVAFLKKAIRFAVELQRRHAQFVAKCGIKNRGNFYPLIAQVQLGVTMKNQ